MREVLLTPVTRQSPFGTLEQDRQFGTWKGSAMWQGCTVCLTIDADGGTYDDALATAQALWAAEAEWHGRIAAYPRRTF